MKKERISDIKKKLEEAKIQERDALLEFYREDERAGVAALIKKYEKQKELEKKEDLRLEEMLSYEREYAVRGIVCGIDEAGRGPLAGPVVAGAVILPEGCKIRYLNDSKQLSQKRREALYDEIMEKAVSVGVGMASPARIDEINILQATYEAMREALKNLTVKPDVLLNDAVRIPDVEGYQVPIVHGDAKSLSIAAASVIAKVTRDRLMTEYDLLMPEYGFAGHKGYGSQAHMEAIREHGPSPIHRMSFLKNIL